MPDQTLESMSNEDLLSLYKKYNQEAEVFDSRQSAAKISINSFYGAFSNKFFRLYDPALSSAVTANGQLVIKWVRKRLNEYFNKLLKTENEAYVVYVDTDAVNLCLDKFVEKYKKGASNDEIKAFLLKCIPTFDKVINDAFLELTDLLNCRVNKMEMKCEAISPIAIWLKKKRYFMPIMYAEGIHYDPWKLKIKGIECNRSSVPYMCRDKIKSSLELFLYKGEDDIKEFVSDFKQTFMSSSFGEMASPRGVNGIDKYSVVDDNGMPVPKACRKGGSVPEHVMASINYNRQLIFHGLDKTLQPIRSGDKIRFVKLRNGNPTGYKAIAFRSELPKEFKLDLWVDTEQMFEVTFLRAIESIVEAVEWNKACLTETQTLF